MENSKTNFQLLISFIIIYYYYYQWHYKDYSTTMIYPHYFKPYQEMIVEFINWSMRSSFSSEFMFHQLTTSSNHTSTVPEVRCHILILLLMMLSSSPASPHNFLYQVPKGDLLTTFIPLSRLQNTTSNCCNFLLTLSSCFLVIAPIHNTVAVKSVGTLPVILVKLVTPPLPP